MKDPMTETVSIYNPKKDRIETLRFRRLKTALQPKVKIELVPVFNGIDARDGVRGPILRILMDREHELDPGISCVKGGRSECDLYDRLVRTSNAFLRQTSKWERARILTTPESAFLQGEPRFCRFCLMEEHKRRKRENRPWRRFARCLHLNR